MDETEKRRIAWNWIIIERCGRITLEKRHSLLIDFLKQELKTRYYLLRETNSLDQAPIRRKIKQIKLRLFLAHGLNYRALFIYSDKRRNSY